MHADGAGHRGPEPAQPPRPHLGVLAPGATQLCPDGQVIEVHPWEYNEVPVVLAAALKAGPPIIALHLTRPPIEIPDREALGMPSHFEAARGAYVMRAYRDDQPKMGVVLVQGTMSTYNLVQALPRLDQEGINVKVVAAISPQLFALQDSAYRDGVYTDAERLDAMIVTNRSRRLMTDWIDPVTTAPWALCSDFDDRWRTGGSVGEVLEEAHLSPDHIFAGIARFARARAERRAALKARVDALG